MTVTLELSPDMAQKLRNIAQGQTSDAQATVKDLLAQVLPESAPTESDLLLQINALGLPAPVRKRNDALVARRQKKKRDHRNTDGLGAKNNRYCRKPQNRC